jgi:hypothetical protein
LASTEQNEREAYRVIVLSRDGPKILLVPEGERHKLPAVEIPRCHRVAEHLTAAVERQWGEEVVCLFEPEPAPADGAVIRYEAAEHLCTRSNPTMATRWVPMSALCQDSLIDTRDYSAIKRVTGIGNAEIEDSSAGPFARLGWFCELRSWIQSVVEPMGFHIEGEFRQLNASPSFSLIRFKTEGPALWFKAVGEPNQREFAITCSLAQRYPDYLPRMLALRPEWNGWLTREATGELLSEVKELTLWEQAAASLAKLQIQSIDHGSQILGAGASDLGSAALSKLIQPFMNVATQLMERQAKLPPPALGQKDLLLVADSLRSAVDAMEAAETPETLGHLDLNPGNIIVSQNRCAFLDWAEAYVGNPLFSLEYLLEHARRTLGSESAVRARLTAAYCAQWNGVVTAAGMAKALAFAPLVAAFAYAAGNELWKKIERLEEAATAGYLRSLTRRMHREANALADGRTLCHH